MTDGAPAPYGQPPGWYVDPYVQGFLRWWDGGRWADATRPILREEPMPARAPEVGHGGWGAQPTRDNGSAGQRQSPGDGYDGREPEPTRDYGAARERKSQEGRRGDWGTAPAAQTRLRHEPPRFAPRDSQLNHTNAPPLRQADESATRIDEFTHANGAYRGEDRGERRGVAPEVNGRSQAARGAIRDRPSQEADSAAEEIRRSGLSRLVLSALFGFSLVLFAAGFALDNDVLRLVALIGALFFGLGTAPLQLSERALLDLRLCVAGLVGLSVPLFVASVLVLPPLWHPLLAMILFGAVSVGVHVVACRRVLSGPLGLGILRSARLDVRDYLDASVACSLGGTLLWLAGMGATGHVVPGVLGFLPKAPVYWYLGLALLVAGIMLARGKGESRAAFGAVSLLAALTLTPSVVYGMPRSQSAAKHIDLVQNILQAHSLSATAGIYRAYSGFFSAVAWLCDLSGMHNVTGIATYFPFFIDLIGVACLRFFLGRLTASRYRIWVAITLTILVNSIGADYFSPQAVGFVLGIGVFGLALNQGNAGLSQHGRTGILVLVGCAMAVTHELSPFIVGGALAVLVVFRVIRPWYVPATMLIPAGIWAFLNRGDLSGFITLGAFGNLSNFAPPQQASALGLQRLPIVGQASDALALGLFALIVIAGIGLSRNIRSRAAWAFMISTGVGLVLIAANPYGGEGIFRAALFGIPWLAAVGTQALPTVRSRWASAIYGVVAVGLVGTYLVSMFGLDNTNVIRPSDYQALLTYQGTASPYSYMLGLNYGVNLPVSVDFPQGNNHFVEWGTLITQAQAEIAKPTTRDAATLAQQYYKYAKDNDGETSQLYAVWSPANAEYDVDYGRSTLAQAEAWRSALIASADWKVVYSSDGTYLFRVASNVSAPVKSMKTAGKT
jgi:hypothetical protein